MLPRHLNLDPKKGDACPYSNVSEQDAQGQSKSVVKFQGPYDCTDAADVHKHPQSPPEGEVKKEPSEHGIRLVALVESDPELSILQSVDGDEIFGGVVDEGPKLAPARLGVDADWKGEGDPSRDDHEDAQKSHQERGSVEVELGNDKRAADDERQKGNDHGDKIDPAGGVELPAVARQQGSALLAAEEQAPGACEQDPELADAKGRDGGAQDVLVELAMGDGTRFIWELGRAV